VWEEVVVLSAADKEVILACARKYDVEVLYLFGSTVEGDLSRDIDLAVKGIKPELFFKFYGELLRKLSKSVDVVDLSRKSLFNDLIETRGVKLYG
jgi:predicted nucleotidyltransferase